MLVLPGPAILVIPIGLAILALEFAWAERLLDLGVESGLNFQGWLKNTLTAKRLLFGGTVLCSIATGIALYALGYVR